MPLNSEDQKKYDDIKESLEDSMINIVRSDWSSIADFADFCKMNASDIVKISEHWIAINNIAKSINAHPNDIVTACHLKELENDTFRI